MTLKIKKNAAELDSAVFFLYFEPIVWDRLLLKISSYISISTLTHREPFFCRSEEGALRFLLTNLFIFVGAQAKLPGHVQV
jgi:hypothetical protein